MTNLVQYGNTFSMLATGRIFGLDKQLLVDVCFQGIAILILFAFLSYILFDIENEKDYCKAIIYYISGMTDNFAIDTYNKIIGF